MDTPAVVTLTAAAAARIRALMAAGGPPAAGLRLSVSTKGCSGLSYAFERVAVPGPRDERVAADGAVVFVDPLAVMYVWGTRIDWREDRLQAAFAFENPNESGRCGCGQSFHVG